MEMIVAISKGESKGEIMKVSEKADEGVKFLFLSGVCRISMILCGILER